MKERRFRSSIAGIVVGLTLGMFYYIVLAKCLLGGSVKGLMLPPDLYQQILLQTLIFGGGPGVVIGLIYGLRVSIHMPRGHMSKGISLMAFLVSTIIGFIINGSQLATLSAGKIFMTICAVAMLFLLAIPIGGTLGVIEKIRE